MRRSDEGFTLVELLVAMTILVILASVAYSSFSHALNVYQKDATQLAFHQSVRTGLEQITRDLTCAIAEQESQDLLFHAEDVAGKTEQSGRDSITFVTTVTPVVNTESTPPLSPEAPSARSSDTSASSQQEEETEQVPRDLLRVAYLLGYDRETLASSSASEIGSDETLPLSLLRITSPTLNPEDAFGDALEQDMATMVTTLEELGATVEVVIDNVLSLDFGFFDGEEWSTTWDEEEQGIPKAVRVSLTVEDPRGEGRTFTRSSAATLVLNLTSGADQSAQTGQGQQGQQGQQGSQGQQGQTQQSQPSQGQPSQGQNPQGSGPQGQSGP